MINQEAVIQLAMGFWPIVGKRFRNPLRHDQNPGCFFDWKAGYLRLFDYADALFNKANCFDLLSIARFRKRIDTEEEKNKVLGIIKSEILGMKPSIVPEEFRFLIQYELSDISKATERYIEQYGITKSQLIDDGISGCHWFQTNSRREPLFFKKRFPSDPCLVMTYPRDHVKIYRPERKEKYMKWTTNCWPDDVHFENDNKVKDLWVLGSWKDGRVSKNAGLEVRGLQSENILPSFKTWKKWEGQCENLRILFDLDEAGINLTKRCGQVLTNWGIKHNLHYLPEGVLKFGLKDVADIRKKWDDRVIFNTFKKCVSDAERLKQ